MKITKSQLKRIIKEELEGVILEDDEFMYGRFRDVPGYSEEAAGPPKPPKNPAAKTAFRAADDEFMYGRFRDVPGYSEEAAGPPKGRKAAQPRSQRRVPGAAAAMAAGESAPRTAQLAAVGRNEAESLKAAAENIPKGKAGAFKKLIQKLKIGGKIPIIGRFFTAGVVLLMADEAYAADGMDGVAKVIADNAVDFVPIVGDIKGVMEIVSAIDPAYTAKGKSQQVKKYGMALGSPRMYENKITKSQLKQIIKEELERILGADSPFTTRG